MIVVSDTGPLNYLAVLGHLDALASLYGRVVIPMAVVHELSRPTSPQIVRELIENPGEWLKTESSPARDPGLADLGDGEQEAIVLALTLHADLLLCDDKDARSAAVERGVRVIGTVGVLSAAANEGLLDLVDALSRLCRTNFRISRTVLKQILEQHRTTS